MKRKIGFVFVLICEILISFHSIWAADYEKDKDNMLNLRIFAGAPTLALKSAPSQEITAESVNYNPNVNGAFGYGLSYRNIGLSYAGSAPQTSESMAYKGTTKGTDYQLKLFGKKLTYEFFYQKYAGYYIENSATVDSSYTGSNKIKRPDLTTQKAGVTLIYNFQPDNFSLASNFGHVGAQTRTSGSWLAFANLSQNAFNSSPYLLPDAVRTPYGSYSQLKAGTGQNVGYGVGYGLSLVLYRFYLAAQLLVGGVAQSQSLEFADLGPKTKNVNASISNVKVGLGYNGTNLYWGVQVLNDSISFPSPDQKYTINATSTEAYFFLGHRFEGVNLPFLNPISSLLD